MPTPLCLYVYLLGHLGGYQLWTIAKKKNAIMTVHVQAFVWTWVFISFKQILISEIAGSQYRYIFKFLINYQVVFQRGCAILHSTSSVLIILGVVYLIFSFFQFNCSVVSDSLQPHGPQHASPPCPSPNPVVYPNSCPLSW